MRLSYIFSEKSEKKLKFLGNRMLYPCLCCGYLTRSETSNGDYDICSVCFWEDDPVQAEDNDYGGGANEPSLNQARENFKKY